MKTGFLDDGGKTGALLRSHPWTRSGLGPIEQWPDSLRTVVSLMLDSPCPTFLLWGEQRICLYNDGYIPLLGKRHPAALAAPFRQTWPEIWDELSPLIDRAYAGTSTFLEDLPLLVERNGFREQVYFTFSYSPLREPQGGVAGLFCTCTETTGRRQAEAALRYNEARWRSLFEHMQEGFFVAEALRDAQGTIVDFRLVEANPAFEAQRGFEPGTAPGRSIREMLPPVPVALLHAYAEVLESGQPRQFEIDLGPANGRWYEVRARPAEYADRVAVMFLDITARKKAEVALRRSEVQFRRLAQAMPDQAWTARPDGALDWFNDRVYDYTGRTVGDLQGDRWRSIVHADDRPAAEASWARAVVSEAPYQAEFRLRRADGAYRWHIARALPILAEDGSIDRWIGTNTDIETQKRAAELLELRIAQRSRELEKANEELRQSQKMEAVGQLTGGIAHDFNNLLTGVIIGLELMQARLTQGRRDEAERCAGMAMQSAQRAAALTHRLLAFSRRQPLEPRAVCVNELIRSMKELIGRTIGPSIQLDMCECAGLWTTHCDLNQLENTLLNLVINARDAMPDGGRLTIAACNREVGAETLAQHGAGPGEYVCLTVSDDGVGMTPETAARVFEPFYTTKPIGRGTGLGLSMVYGFARQSGGYVQLDSQLGVGTDVSVYLPRYHGAVEESPSYKAQAPLPRAASRTVLVVDDEPQVRELIAALLRDLGHRCLQAADGPDGLEVICSPAHVVDLLITDVGLPGLSGRQLAARARELQPGLKVLFITGYADDAIFDVDAASGVELLNKPFTTAELAARVRRLTAAVETAGTHNG
ncbi:PAS domain-containing protein [Rhodanobacter umsongensis]|uniref:histidine kinase n=1 Tax=Rhodanobacter umsongensis TaxID=633153 RepID=A0ABW0JQK0_9GAMM